MMNFESQDEVLKVIAESWSEINKSKDERNLSKGVKSTDDGEDQMKQDKEATVAVQNRARTDQTQEKKSRGGFFARFGKRQNNERGTSENEESRDDNQKTGTGEKTFDMPETFNEMVKLNAAMTGANATYINIVLDEFGNIVRDVCKFGQLQEQTDILAMRISKDVKEAFKTSEFKICMLASMRSFIPAMWDTRHENAWLWLWESIDVQLKDSLRQPPKYEKPVARWVNGLEREERRAISMAIWKRMFLIDPEAERVFKQSNERLIFIVEKAFEFSAKIYQNPSETREYIQGLGLRHIMFGAKPKNFEMFVNCMRDELTERGIDEVVISGVHWSVSIIASTMARTVEQGSTPILMAALSNNAKELKKSLASQPRGSRAKAMLNANTGRGESSTNVTEKEGYAANDFASDVALVE
jgi:hemoglobin-like flavoprotein